MGRVFATLSGVLILALFAGGMTEAALAVGHTGWLADDVKVRPGMASSPKQSATPKASATPSPTATPKPASTPVAAPGAITNSFVHLRASNSLSSAILVNLDGGTALQLMPYSDSQWQ